ncbi:MAG: hypothetical protein E7260_10425 [Lachnospiraceae bacterium]|nr:hypothetical protein [Lachnospiraceae bacterium]
MHKKVRKTIVAAVLGLLLMGALAACNSNGENGSETTTTPVPTAEPTQAAEPTKTTEPTQAAEPTAGPVEEPTPAPGQLSFGSWDGVTVASHGERSEKAQIVGDGLCVGYVGGQYVLIFRGGDGYLELPKNLFAEVTDGFRLSYRYKSTGKSNATVFQTNLCGYDVGDTYWRDAPEISLAADGKFRLYVGGRTINGVYNPVATYNNGVSGVDAMDYAEPGGHKTRYEAATKELENGKWHEVTLSISKTEVHIFMDGEEVALQPTDVNFNLASSLDYLLNTLTDGKTILSEYVQTSFGNSVYNDIPNFEGYIDEIRVYTTPLEMMSTVAAETPAYHWTFDAGDLQGPLPLEEKDLSLYMGELPLTEVPELLTLSPDGKTKVRFWKDEKGSYYYSVTENESVIVESSLLGMELKEGNLYEGLSLRSDGVTRETVRESYELFTGYNAVMENHSCETRFCLENEYGSFVFAVSVHNDGFAYRYEEVTAGTANTVTALDEKSEVILPKTSNTWAFELNGHYEGTYIKRNHSQLASLEQKMSTPMLVKNGNYWMVITEAAAINNDAEFCTSALQTKRGSATLRWDFGLRRDPAREAKGDLDFPGMLPITEVSTVNGFTTPWRAFVLSDDLNEFVNSSLITDLNPVADETLYADTSYIKPGKVAWSWWAEEGAQGTYAKHVEYIDFAAENGWDYVCLDVGWRSFEQKLSDLCAYAKEKGVGIFVWVNYRDIRNAAKMEQLFTKWKEAGIVGLKTDYFEGDETAVLKVMQNVAECSAKLQLMVLYHGCIRPGGECRTYPNILSTEAVYGEENHKWSEDPSLQNCLLYPFVRNICGSMDYTPAGTKVDSQGSYGFSLAQTIVYESALQHFAYAAASYKNYNGLALLNHIPTEWEESVLLEGYPGEYATMARRNGENWFVGAMTVEERNVEISLAFLGTGEYHMYLYQDKADGTGLELCEKTVTAGDKLVIQLADGGGFAAMFTKGTIDTTVGVNEAVNPSGYTYYEAESSDNILSGAAVKASSAFCSGGQKVGYIGYSGNTLTFTKVTVPEDGVYRMLVYYCSGENRKVILEVNGKTEYTLTGLNSGDYVHTAMTEILVELQSGANTVMFSNPSYYAPDIDRIAVSEGKVQ